MNHVDWADPNINLDVIFERLATTNAIGNPHAAPLPPGVRQRFENYLISTPWRPETAISDLKFNSKWDQLVPGSNYLVVAFHGYVRSGVRPVLGAAVMRFLGYEDLPLAATEMHKSNINNRINALRGYIEDFKRQQEGDDDPFGPDPFNSDEEIPEWGDDDYDPEGDALDEIEELKDEVTRAWQKGLRFEELTGDGDGPRRTFLIDFAPGGPFDVEVMKIHGYGYGHWIESSPEMARNDYYAACEGATTMNRLRSGYARHVLRSVAAMRIQRAWRKYMARRDSTPRHKWPRETTPSETPGIKL